MGKKRIVITGLGAISPIGNNVDELWNNLMNGVGGIDRITLFDPSDVSSKIAGEVKNFNPLDYFDAKEIKKMDRFIQFAMVAANEAINDSGIDFSKEDPYRSGVIVGSGIGGLSTIEAQHTLLKERGARRVSPFFVPMEIINMAPGLISIKYGIKGPNYAVVSACATSAHAVGSAMRALEHGDADVMITGGAEAAVTPLAVAGFSNMRALSTRNDEPDKACRPFDKDRDGFIIAEGGAIIVLETLEHAQARGAKIYAEIAGFGATADAYHITAPAESGEGAQMAMKLAISDAGLKPEDIDYINAHGTSTPFNDKIETRAIKNVFGEHAKKLAVSSTKSMTGHLLGASGSIEALICALALNRSVLPPTINLENPDPLCDLDYVPNVARKADIKAALSNSLGFGGHNAVLAFKKYE